MLGESTHQNPFERYVVLKYLAEGGMGAIYVGKKLGAGGFEKEVVLKQLLPEFTQQPEFIELFMREARLSATLDHVNIVHTIDLVRSDDQLFMVMEYVKGGDLRTLLKRAKRRRLQLHPSAGLFVAREVLSALAYAHQKTGMDGQPLGLIHRDVSPSNILVSGEGEVKLTDFGIAKATTHNSTYYRVRGKVGYMSPEQARSEPVDLRSDLYSLAIVLYEMLTGERLFVAAGLTTAVDVLYGQPVPRVSEKSRGLPRSLDELLEKALHLDRDRRFQSAGEFHEALLRLSHRERLMATAREAAAHFSEACGVVDEWHVTRVGDFPGEGTHQIPLPISKERDQTHGILKEEYEHTEAANDLEEDSFFGEFDNDMREASAVRPGLDYLPPQEARKRLRQDPTVLTGLELSSVIRGETRELFGGPTSEPAFSEPSFAPEPGTPSEASRASQPSDVAPRTDPPRVRHPERPSERLPNWVLILLLVCLSGGIIWSVGLSGPPLSIPEPEPMGFTNPELGANPGK